MTHSVLVIEDDASIRNNILQLLSFEGYAARGAADGVEGIAIAEAMNPDLIICDVLMPNMDGYEVLEHIRKSSYGVTTPFIFLTARSTRQDMRRGMSLGADDFIPKPYSDSELLDAIALRLQKHAQTQHLGGGSDATEQGAHAPKKVLIVRASQIVHSLIERTLNSIVPDAETIVVSTAQKLGDSLREHFFTLAIVDAGAFDNNGEQVLTIIRADTRHLETPIVYIANSNDHHHQARMDALGVRFVVQRPINTDELYNAIVSATQQGSEHSSGLRDVQAQLVVAIIDDRDYFRRIENILHPRYSLQILSTWNEALRLVRTHIPHYVFFDLEPTDHQQSEFMELCSTAEPRCIRISESNSNTAHERFPAIKLPKSADAKSLLHVLIRSVLQRTGEYEYNVLDVLQDHLLSMFRELVSRQCGLNSPEIRSPFTSAAPSQDVVESTLVYRLKTAQLQVLFSMSSTPHRMMSLLDDMHVQSESVDVLSDAVKLWNIQMSNLSARLNTILNYFGIAWSGVEITTRQSIDRLPDSFHWYKQVGLIQPGLDPITIRIGVQLAPQSNNNSDVD